jgi:predicted adenylyl cyclase CyaB
MKDDIQVRFRVEDAGEMTEKIASMDAEPLPDTIETDTYYNNTALGFEHGAGTSLLRIREVDGRTELTLKHVKGYTKEGWATPTREFESVMVGITDKMAMDEILRAMQFTRAHVYRKTKKSWKAGTCVIELHAFVFGTWMEVKGPRDSLAECVAALGLAMDGADRKGYPYYYEAYCIEKGIAVGTLM